MSVFSDSAGNWYLGDCRFANHDMNYPSTPYLLAQPLGGLSGLLTNLASSCGFQSFGNIAPQNILDNRSIFQYGDASAPFIDFSPFGDTFMSSGYRFLIRFGRLGYSSFESHQGYMRNNSNTVNLFSSQLGNGQNSDEALHVSSPYNTLGESGTQFVINADSKSLTIFIYRNTISSNRLNYSFMHLGELSSVNPHSYYSSNFINKYVLLSHNNMSTNQWGRNHFHYIAGTAKYLLETSDATYPIACADNTIPNSQWATDFLVFDNNSTLGFPCIGKIRNMLISTATGLTIGKPVYIDGSAVSDGGSRWFIPVGTFAGRTMLMRCYSSVVVS